MIYVVDRGIEVECGTRISLQILEFNILRSIFENCFITLRDLNFSKIFFFKIADSKKYVQEYEFSCNLKRFFEQLPFASLSILLSNILLQNSIQHVWHSFYDSSFRIEMSNARIKAVIRFENNENLIAIKIKTRQTLPVNSINPSPSFARNNWTNVYHRFERTFTNHALILTIFTCQ